jgi:MFS family permease
MYGIPFPSQPSGYLVPATWQSVWIGCLLAAIAVGSIFAGALQNRIGRKHLLLIGAVINAGGIGFLQGAQDWKQWLGGKILNGIGIGLVYTLSPVWYFCIDFTDVGSAKQRVLRYEGFFFAFSMRELSLVSFLPRIEPLLGMN